MSGDDTGSRAGSDSETFARWFELHHDRLVAQCVRMLRDRAASEDIAQETLLRAWLGRERMREEDLPAWLSVVARNLCVSYIRRQKKQIPTETLPDVADESADPSRIAERNESRRAVRRAMKQVGERHRKLLFLREVEGVDYEEISEELGLTPSGTRAVLFRARHALRERLVAVGEGVGAFLLGLWVRARMAAHSVTQHLEAMSGSILQVGMAFAVAGTLSIPSLAAVIPGSNGLVSGRERSTTSLADPLSARLSARQASQGSGGADAPVVGEQMPGVYMGRPGLTPDGGAKTPSVADPRPHRKGHYILGWWVDWEPGTNYTPTHGYVSYWVARTAGSTACSAEPVLCP